MIIYLGCVLPRTSCGSHDAMRRVRPCTEVRIWPFHCIDYPIHSPRNAGCWIVFTHQRLCSHLFRNYIQLNEAWDDGRYPLPCYRHMTVPVRVRTFLYTYYICIATILCENTIQYKYKKANLLWQVEKITRNCVSGQSHSIPLNYVHPICEECWHLKHKPCSRV